MTAFAFILGVVPLLTASGAGAEARKVMGMAVFSGMLIATIFGVLLVPVLFVLIEKIGGGRRGTSRRSGSARFGRSLRMRGMRFSRAAVAALALTACMVGPAYHRPEVPTPAGFRGADSTVIMDSAKSIADVAWFEYFQDTTLKSLIHQALLANFDLRIASARVAEVQAQYGIARSGLYPQIDLGAGASATRSPRSRRPRPIRTAIPPRTAPT